MQGIAREMAGPKIREFLAERNRAIRRKGFNLLDRRGGLGRESREHILARLAW
jgi:hypothetical protein